MIILKTLLGDTRNVPLRLAVSIPLTRTISHTAAYEYIHTFAINYILRRAGLPRLCFFRATFAAAAAVTFAPMDSVAAAMNSLHSSVPLPSTSICRNDSALVMS